MMPETLNLQSFIANCVDLVDSKLDEIVPTADTEPTKLHEAIRHSLFAGGKRFRPAFVFAVGETFGVPFEKLVTVAAAIEMIHTYSLIHDDLPAMDDDDLRRGKPTCHVKYGEATAILAGDALETLAFKAIAEDENLSADVRVRLVAEIANASGTPNGMVAGQQVDLESERKKISIEELEAIHREKTGAIIEVSARVGAIIAGASKEKLEAVTKYASSLGLLFQITDDLLDVTQTTEVLGKTAGKDASAEKATYPSLCGVEGAHELARKTYEEACRELTKLDGETRLLHQLADYILKRNK